jgi:hypothetical protein
VVPKYTTTSFVDKVVDNYTEMQKNYNSRYTVTNN